MPWKKTSKQEQRFDLVRQIISGLVPVTELCRRFKIARQTAYKWLARYRKKRLAGLRDQSQRPDRVPSRTSKLWLRRLKSLRLRQPSWGVRKLQYWLDRRFGKRGQPGLASMSRWLKRWGLAVGKARRRRGPQLRKPSMRVARRSHDVWTVDFKGWYRTGRGLRVEPLTVRDLFSRYGLIITLLRRPTVVETRREFARLFSLHGLPLCIRCDNGSPFGGSGPTGLTRLSAWWVKLGIEVDFMTPGCPYENGAHEQFHRIYKAEVARKPEPGRRAQPERSTKWLRHYNGQRPHEGIGMRRPVELFDKNTRRMPKRIQQWNYPAPWERKWVKGNGEINWRGQWRYVGEAFVHDYVGLKAVGRNVWKVYFGPLLIGELHQQERGSIRMAKYRNAK